MAFYIQNTYTNEAAYPAYQDFNVRVDSTNFTTEGLTYFYPNGWVPALDLKMVLSIYVNDVLAATLKKPFNEYGQAIFNIESVLQDYVNTDVSSYHADGVAPTTAMHNIPKFSKNNNSLVKVELKGGYEYISSVSGNLVSYPNIQVSSGNYLNVPFFVFNGARQNRQEVSFNFEDYVSDNSSRLLLTDFEQVGHDTNLPTVMQKVRNSDYHTIAFFNGKYKVYDGQSLQDNTVWGVSVTFYNDAGSTIYTFNQANIASQGGELSTNNMSAEGGLLFRGVGIQNMLDASLITLTDIAGATYYKVAVAKNNSYDIGLSPQYFRIQNDDCKSYETIRLAWVNSLGAWDYYNFTKRSTRSTNSRRTTFTQNYGTNLQGSTGYKQFSYEGGLQSFNNTVTQSIEANTDFIHEVEATFLENLFTSPKVQMQNDSGEWENVLVTEKNYVKQTSANDKVIQYVIDIQYSHNKTVSSL